jgi:hypothetical protein
VLERDQGGPEDEVGSRTSFSFRLSLTSVLTRLLAELVVDEPATSTHSPLLLVLRTFDASSRLIYLL